ncbi:Lrp/AsnC family transcriptional regulator, partial [Candidatus Woesearchaeota archaeon]|nr:Lrp/AsnC family transcriptional regulator [Candidatus Woesearchaeota archaeon]
KIDLSADAIGIRIKKLVECNIIKKFSISYDFGVIGYNWFTFVINMRVFDSINEKKFMHFIQNCQGIVKAKRTFGGWGILINIVASNSKSYHELIRKIKTTFGDILFQYTTYDGYREHHYDAMPRILSKQQTL